ncbi:ilvB operon leader peptide IvbL [Dickeya chrysanthemi]|nr:ilvB operon leader peptide IvbL [Dickeya chrysanthemi]
MRFPVKHTTSTFALLNNTALLDAVVVVRVVVVVGSAP